ncbi:MAG: hypothetical protein R3313_00340 [Candidatus Saccharimonadales bacterium]|nr:hypothetical protein [Candidatus Saccharimonadales bacterium]
MIIQTRKLKITLMILSSAMLVASLALPGLVNAQGNGNGQAKKADVAARIAERKAEAKEKVEEKRAQRELKTQEKRQEACERRLAKLASSMDRIQTQATKHLGVIDSFFEKVQGFYDSGQLTVSNYDELLVAAEAAQENAQIEVEALGDLNVEIDCEDPEVAVDIGSYKQGTSMVKQALKDYRKALVSLISSMRAAAAEEKAKNEDDSSESESEDESEEVKDEAPEDEAPEDETPDDSDDGSEGDDSDDSNGDGELTN